MSDSAKHEERRAWLERVFALDLSPAERGGGAHPADGPSFPPPPRGTAEDLLGRPPTEGPITQSKVVGPKQDFTGADGRTLGVTKGQNGKVALTLPPPPITEVTFAGGGGKGAALPGAVKALHDSGALDSVKQINGASVGSLTGILLASGATTEEFTQIANDPALAGKLTEGKGLFEMIFIDHITGMGAERQARNKSDELLLKRVSEYETATKQAGGTPDKAVLAIADRLERTSSGATFGDMRTLAAVIKKIKEIKISATWVGEVDPSKGELKPDARAQLYMFSADTEPDIQVSLAVRASASLPPVFDPVDIKLPSMGITVRFQDGGVMNNVPSSDSLGDDRDLDPIPAMGSLEFVFEDKVGAKDGPLTGISRPEKSAFADWITKAPNSAANYETFQNLMDKPEDVVVVPLHYDVKSRWRPSGKKTKDFTGELSGTTNFDMPTDERLMLQGLTDKATAAHLQKRKQPQTRDYDSMGQMLMSVSAADLKTMASQGLDGAKEAEAFRNQVLGVIATLTARMGAISGPAMQDKEIIKGLAELDTLSGQDVDRLGFIGREMNRGGLDGLVSAAHKAGTGGAAAAGAVVADALKAKSSATFILRHAIYPVIVVATPKSVEGTLLAEVVAKMRAARTSIEVNDTLRLAIDYYSNKGGLLDGRRYKKIAADLNAYIVPIS